MEHFNLTPETLKELIQAVSASGIEGISLKCDQFKLNICGKSAQVITMTAPVVQQAAPVSAEVSAVHALPEAPAAKGQIIKSPIVGTFYVAASPDSEPFVKIGQTVKKGDVLFVIESMKVMNEVQSDFSGVITEIFVDNSSPVEYGQPILAIE